MEVRGCCCNAQLTSSDFRPLGCGARAGCEGSGGGGPVYERSCGGGGGR